MRIFAVQNDLAERTLRNESGPSFGRACALSKTRDRQITDMQTNV